MLFGKRKTDGGVQWLVVCLGNPGDKYENTRHNAGFLVADALSKRHRAPVNKLKNRALTGVVDLDGQKVLVMKPMTYMNLSGEAVGPTARFYKIPADHVLVVSDDTDLPLGKLRVRRSGSAGGHNGLKSIIAHLGTDQFPRVKVGGGEKTPPGLRHGGLGALPLPGGGQEGDGRRGGDGGGRGGVLHPTRRGPGHEPVQRAVTPPGSSPREGVCP